MGKRELAPLLSLTSWCLVIVVWLFLAVPWVCLLFVIVVFPDHTHYFSYWILALIHYLINKLILHLGKETVPVDIHTI